MTIRAALGLIAVFVVLGLVGALYVQTERLSAAEHDRDEAREQLASANRAISELATERAAANRRNEQARTAREGILSAPVTDDAPISNVLRRGLEAADRIGGAL